MRVAIIFDIHSNFQALEAVAKDIKKQSPDYVYCLGDIVGYGPQPRECVDWVRAKNVNVCVLGNHDGRAVRCDNGDFAAGFTEEKQFDSRLHEFNAYAELTLRQNAALLSVADKEFLARLPRRVTFCTGITICHGSYSNPWQYITSSYEANNEARLTPSPLTLIGHTHSPFVFRAKGQGKFILPVGEETFEIPTKVKSIVNVGSVGQPRDLDYHSCYVILDCLPDKFVCHFRRVSYNINKTAKLMRKMGIDSHIIDFLIERLYKGK
ncbi:metallophosphoesterase family protein [Candidatus Falkowbacteria bacterium]|nr:metallophosphoesterase family protein [Candidatus Falkowbacteria bacterium]